MTQPRLTFRPRHRLTHANEFKAVYDLRLKRSRGPLTIFARPNQVPHDRLGLSVGSRVGNAVARNGIKRKLREAFRQLQHDLPLHAEGGYDLVINVRPHEAYALAGYRDLLLSLVGPIHAEAVRRGLVREASEGDAK
ncbi:MAG: ribonuclease P protein component [Phycisphaerales bacterium]|nr:ribonuclease P protein component [Phycisphaerales bacterium]